MMPYTQEVALMRWLNKAAEKRPKAKSSYKGFCLTYAASLKNSNYAFTWKHEEEDLLYVLQEAPGPLARCFWLLIEGLMTDAQIQYYTTELGLEYRMYWFLASFKSRKRIKTEQGAKRRLNYF
jgi:hypothetical protein